MESVLVKYLKAFKKLRLDRSHGIAPHKPILLLSVLQTYQNQLDTGRRIFLSPELVALFRSNWNLLVRTKHDCRISYPFYYLKSEKFWKLVPRDAHQSIEKIGNIVKSLFSLNAAVEYAEIEEDLFDLMRDRSTNAILTQFLLDEYFPKSKGDFEYSIRGQQSLFSDIENKILHEPPLAYQREVKALLDQHNEEDVFLRGSLFKREIPKIYQNTCCISGMKIDATVNVSMIDACHIVPFSVSYDDTVTNGIALCPNLHRAFDRGLIAIDEHYKVVVSKTFKEDEKSYSIRAFEGKEILLPKMKSYYPLRENLGWHKINIFKAQ